MLPSGKFQFILRIPLFSRIFLKALLYFRVRIHIIGIFLFQHFFSILHLDPVIFDFLYSLIFGLSHLLVQRYLQTNIAFFEKVYGCSHSWTFILSVTDKAPPSLNDNANVRLATNLITIIFKKTTRQCLPKFWLSIFFLLHLNESN